MYGILRINTILSFLSLARSSSRYLRPFPPFSLFPSHFFIPNHGPKMAFAVQLLLLFLASLVSAQSSSSTATSSAATSTGTTTASIYPGTAKWTYYGCWNETTTVNNTAQLRALSGGTTESGDNMTVQTCLDFCGGSTYAGLEYTQYAHSPPPPIDYFIMLGCVSEG